MKLDFLHSDHYSTIQSRLKSTYHQSFRRFFRFFADFSDFSYFWVKNYDVFGSFWVLTGSSTQVIKAHRFYSHVAHPKSFQKVPKTSLFLTKKSEKSEKLAENLKNWRKSGDMSTSNGSISSNNGWDGQNQVSLKSSGVLLCK